MMKPGLATGSRPPLWKARLGVALRQSSRAWAVFRSSRTGLLGIGVIILFALLALAHPLLMSTVWDDRTYHPVTGFAYDVAAHPSPPSASHPLGTDQMGRDVLSQLMVGARTAFVLGLSTAVMTVVLATVVGAVAAYSGGLIDALLMRLSDVMMMMPAVSLLIVLGALFDLNLFSLALALGALAGFGAAAVVLRSQALALKVRTFVDAARVSGLPGRRILLSHIIPGLLPLALLYMMFTVTAAIFAEAVLSYLGLFTAGMSWGIMLHGAEAGGYLLSGLRGWWMTVPAGLCITLLCGSFYLVGRSLDEVLDPRLRTR